MPQRQGAEPPQSPEHQPSHRAAAGLPGAPAWAEGLLRGAGIDPDRLSVLHFGVPGWQPAWFARVALGLLLWAVYHWGQTAQWPGWLLAALVLAAGLLLLQAACASLVSATERLAARRGWAHYVAGTLVEIVATLPELVVIAFVVTISPSSAFVIALITIYNNALVFSLYSFFLPKDTQGKYVMPKPITEAGSQVLVAGAALGLILGLTMLTMTSAEHPKETFSGFDLVTVAIVLLTIFSVYVYKLVYGYASEEAEVRRALALTPDDEAQRRALVYSRLGNRSYGLIGLLFVVGVAGAFAGGHLVSVFAESAIGPLQLNPVLTALFLALFAGMSEYVILWQSHQKREYGIALANAFGGMTQVLFLVLPFTLLAVAFQQWGWLGGPATEPLSFSLTHIFLLIFLFPTFFVLVELLSEDHTLGILDTTIMTAIFILLLAVLVTYGGGAV